MGVPKTTLQFDDSLEGLTEFRKAIILVSTVYYSERIQIKVSKGQSPGKTKHEHLVAPSPGSRVDSTYFSHH